MSGVVVVQLQHDIFNHCLHFAVLFFNVKFVATISLDSRKIDHGRRCRFRRGSKVLLRLLKPVYGRPDALRVWHNELSRILQKELGFQKSAVDSALFCLRDHQGRLHALMIVYVDGHDGPDMAKQIADRLHERFLFGT